MCTIYIYFQRFVPSEFGNEVDRVSGLPPFEAILANKRRIRRATEVAGVPYTYISANSFAAYFINYLLHPYEKTDQFIVYGKGDAMGKLINYHLSLSLSFYVYSFSKISNKKHNNYIMKFHNKGNFN